MRFPQGLFKPARAARDHGPVRGASPLARPVNPWPGATRESANAESRLAPDRPQARREP